MNGFSMEHFMLGDVLGFCAAAHLYSAKIGRPVHVWFDPSRREVCQYFDGVVWKPRKQLPQAIDCSGTPTPVEWPQLNGVKRFYRYMDPTMRPTKSFDIHFNRTRPGGGRRSRKKLIGLITHSNTQGSIDELTLSKMLTEAKRRYRGRKVVLIGNYDNTMLPGGVEDWRQKRGDIKWIIDTVARLDLLIAPQSGPCFIAAGWGVPMWVYRSREPHWDYTLNYDRYRVARWWRRNDYAVFDRIYRTGGWNGVGSGPGSLPEVNGPYLSLLDRMLRYSPSIRTVLDIGCGDWQLMQHLDLAGKDYLGVDVSRRVIAANRRRFARPGVRFETMNPIVQDIPQVDLIIIKDVLAHLPYADIAIMLRKIRERSRFALITDDYADGNHQDIALGEHRPINILAEPFHYPGLTVCDYIGKHVVLGGR